MHLQSCVSPHPASEDVAELQWPLSNRGLVVSLGELAVQWDQPASLGQQGNPSLQCPTPPNTLWE